MAKDLSILVGVTTGCTAMLWLVVWVAGRVGIPAEHLHGPTFVFSSGTIALTLVALFGPILLVIAAQRLLVGDSVAGLCLAGSPWKALGAGIGLGLVIQAANFLLKGLIGGGATFHVVIPAGIDVAEYVKYAAWFLLAL